MLAALITFGVVILVFVLCVIASMWPPGDGGCGCTGDALSGFLPCDRYPECVEDERER